MKEWGKDEKWDTRNWNRVEKKNMNGKMYIIEL